MSLYTTIKADQLQARKNKDTLKASLLTTLIGEIQTEIKSSKKSEDDITLDILLKFIKSAKQSLDIKHTDNVQQELIILESYAPTKLSYEDIILNIKKALELGNTNFGMVMKYFSTNFKGQYDAKEVGGVIKSQIK